jgi:hypothetical protein
VVFQFKTVVFRCLWDIKIFGLAYNRGVSVVSRGVQESLGHKIFRGLKTPRNTTEVQGLSNLLKIRGVPLCLIFGTKNSEHQGTPGNFGSAVTRVMRPATQARRKIQT